MNLKQTSDSISASYAIVMLIIYLAFPILSYFILVVNFKNLHEKETASRIDTLYEGTNLKSYAALAHPTLYQIRRLLTAIIALFLQDYPA